MFWMYILQCADGSYYVGHTDDLEYRLGQHEAGVLPGYTQKRRPVKLAFSQAFGERIEALEAEGQVKGWSRAKKAALIAGDWGAIAGLAKGRHRHERRGESIGGS